MPIEQVAEILGQIRSGAITADALETMHEFLLMGVDISGFLM